MIPGQEVRRIFLCLPISGLAAGRSSWASVLHLSSLRDCEPRRKTESDHMDGNDGGSERENCSGFIGRYRFLWFWLFLHRKFRGATGQINSARELQNWPQWWFWMNWNKAVTLFPRQFRTSVDNLCSKIHGCWLWPIIRSALYHRQWRKSLWNFT